MTTSVRFAPSPTGLLHVGNARAAIVNWLFARSRGGSFMLRLDDTDQARSNAEYAARIEEDLRWLGLGWDRFARQSDRLARYQAAAEALRAKGRLYPAYETEEELARQRALRRARRLPPVYDRSALALGAAERARLEAEGRRPHWRFLLEAGSTAWTDGIRGEVRIDAATVSDPVLIRADGTPLYTFCSVVDDIDFGITDVIRGEDHVTNTLTQIQLFHALGAAPPVFAHFALLVGTDGEALSKREAALSLASLRETGIEPMAVASLIARLGTADPVEPRQTLAELVAGFDLSRFGRAAARFDEAELKHLSARILHGMDFARAAPRLREIGLAAAGEEFWRAVRGNLETMADARHWWRVVAGPLAGVIEAPEYLAQAAALLPPEPWGGDVWREWTAALRERTGRKGRTLFHPLRLALTAREHGPEMHNLLPLIGRERAQARLAGRTA
ncbi:MAG: glutamate--tRNA ligase [Alphaproteobacteria bacterium]|nr:glutamate--tRNA ligase [Alphaproteobacteria bacterium]